MHRTIGACSLVLLEGTFFEPKLCVIKECLAFRAELATCCVVVVAIESYHGQDRLKFSGDSGVSWVHWRLFIHCLQYFIPLFM